MLSLIFNIFSISLVVALVSARGANSPVANWAAGRSLPVDTEPNLLERGADMKCRPDIVRECKQSQANAKCHVENNCVCVCRCKPGYYYDKVGDECNKLHHLDCDDLCAQLDDELECSHTKETQCVYVCARSSAAHHDLTTSKQCPARRYRKGPCVRFANGTAPV
jgi:hypothetical protein